MKTTKGTRVRVQSHLWWPSGGTGIVSDAPVGVNELISESDVEFSGTSRTLKGVNSIITTVWIEFDKPIYDSDDDGPYPAGEVEIQYIEPLND